MCCPLKQAIKDKTSFGLLTFFISMDWRYLMEKPIHKMWLIMETDKIIKCSV